MEITRKQKVIGKIKLNQFRRIELERREMNSLQGGSSGECAYVCGGGTLPSNWSSSLMDNQDDLS